MAASVIVFSRVAPGREEDFLAWEHEIEAVEREFEGFLGHRIEAPADGSSPEWTVIVAFDTQEHLEHWIGSTQRRTLLARAQDFQADLRLERTSYGFGFWSGRSDTHGPGHRHRIFKENLIVLLVLYPTVFLWGYAVGTPLFSDVLAWPWWAVLFVGNLASTQVLGWWFVPWAMRAFHRWLRPNAGWAAEVLGYFVFLVCSAGSMALYAWMIAAIGHA